MTIRGSLSDKNIFVRLLVWLCMIFVLTLPTLVIWRLIAGGNPSVTALKVLQTVQTFVVFIVPVLVAAWLWSDRPVKWLHLDKGMNVQTALLVPLMMILFSPGINLLSVLNQQVVLPSWLAELEVMLKEQEDAASALTELFARADTIPQLCVNLLIMAVLPAIGEELCFRGGLQGLFMEKQRPTYYIGHMRARVHTSVWLTAILFSALHFQFYGFVPRMLLGALLGYLLVFSGSLYVPMLAHFTNNAIAVISYYIAGKGLVSEESIDAFGSGDTWWVGVLSLIAGSVTMWLVVQQQSSEQRP